MGDSASTWGMVTIPTRARPISSSPSSKSLWATGAKVSKLAPTPFTVSLGWYLPGSEKTTDPDSKKCVRTQRFPSQAVASSARSTWFNTPAASLGIFSSDDIVPMAKGGTQTVTLIHSKHFHSTYMFKRHVVGVKAQEPCGNYWGLYTLLNSFQMEEIANGNIVAVQRCKNSPNCYLVVHLVKQESIRDCWGKGSLQKVK